MKFLKGQRKELKDIEINGYLPKQDLLNLSGFKEM